MSTIPRASRFFLVVLSVLLGMALIEAAWLFQRRAHASRAETVLGSRRLELRALRASVGGQNAADAPSRDEVDTTRDTLRTAFRLSEAGNSCCAISPAPADRAEAYFRLAELREHLRTAAAMAGVTLRPAESFGFGSYANTGPDPEHLAEVHRQAQVVAWTIHALLDARPHGLQHVARARPSAARGDLATGSADFFSVDPRLSAGRSEWVTAIPLRVCFTGETRTLREFLSTVVANHSAVRICSVEVEPAPDVSAPPQEIDSTVHALVSANRSSQFTVVLEWLEWRSASTAPLVEAKRLAMTGR
jgi:hypothetical protein